MCCVCGELSLNKHHVPVFTRCDHQQTTHRVRNTKVSVSPEWSDILQKEKMFRTRHGLFCPLVSESTQLVKFHFN